MLGRSASIWIKTIRVDQGSESLNGKFRAECLNMHWFMNLDDARAKMEEYLTDYNEFRPHSALGDKPPITLVNGSPAPPPG
jgi:putative transposase